MCIELCSKDIEGKENNTCMDVNAVHWQGTL